MLCVMPCHSKELNPTPTHRHSALNSRLLHSPLTHRGASQGCTWGKAMLGIAVEEDLMCAAQRGERPLKHPRTQQLAIAITIELNAPLAPLSSPNSLSLSQFLRLPRLCECDDCEEFSGWVRIGYFQPLLFGWSTKRWRSKQFGKLVGNSQGVCSMCTHV